MAKQLHPNVLWAQRKDSLTLTIDVQDCKSPDVKLGDDGAGHATVAFRGAGEGADPEPHAYTLDLTLHAAIDVDASKTAVTDRHIVLALVKKEVARWPRLLAGGGKAPAYIKVDFDRWIDSDEEDEADAAGGGAGGFDFASMMGGAGGGMAGMEGMEGLQSMLAGAGGGAAGLAGMMGGEASVAGGGEDSDDEVEEITPGDA